MLHKMPSFRVVYPRVIFNSYLSKFKCIKLLAEHIPRLNFVPPRDGWHFANKFETRVLPGILYGVKTKGLCGGMVMTALDYWRAGIPIPAHEPSDLPLDPNGNRLPDEASRLRRYIFDRQMNSLLTGLMFTRWITSPTITPDDFHNWATGSEFNVVRRELSSNRPVMLGLWSMIPGHPEGGHQVLCYGWDTDPIRLYIYDPNHPDEETVLTPESPAVGCTAKGSKSGQEETYRGYFFTDVYNWNENPPYAPRYRDIVITSGLNTSPDRNANIGTSLSLSVTVFNEGEYPSRFLAFCIWARDPVGRNIDAAVGGIEPNFKSLNPGESKTEARNFASFGNVPGPHTIGVSKLSLQGHWQNIPPANAGATSIRQLQLWPIKQEVVNKWVTVRESDTNDSDTGVALQPGDEFALTGAGAIWAGVLFTGLNGPEGWMDRIETNLDFPLHNSPDARPFSLLGRFEGEGYFYVGAGLSRRAFNRTSPRRLFLRINDNAPGNGSGAFQCLVQVWR
jgi:hypothetical protein